MASAPPERLDPEVSLAPRPAPDETLPPSPTLSERIDDDAAGIETGAPLAATPSGFPVAGLIAAVLAHVAAVAALYALMMYEPVEEAKPPGDVFEIVLSGDQAGRPDGTARQAPDGAPRPDVLQDPDPRIANQPADQPAPDTLTAPQRPPQPQSFDAMPMPPAPQPVPDTADAWKPQVNPAANLPLAATEPKAADLQTQPKPDPARPDPAKPTPAAKPVTTPAKQPAPAPRPPAPPPSRQAAAPPVPHRPTIQRSVDLRDIAGLAPHREYAAGSSSGNAAAADYASLLFRAIDRVRFYPLGSRERREEGRVMLRVTIATDGQLVDVYIVSGSGHPELDAATIEMARRAAPYPPLPRGLGAERASFNVPIIFGIRRL